MSKTISPTCTPRPSPTSAAQAACHSPAPSACCRGGRKGGAPIWKNADLIANVENPRKADIAEAERFAQGTAKKLGLDTGYVLPAFEDSAHWIQKEAGLPGNVDPSDSRLSDPEERLRMARVFDHGLNTPKGFV